MDYKKLATAALEARQALVDEARIVNDDPKLSNDEKRSRIEALNTLIDAKTDEARSIIAEGEREAEVRNLAAASGGLVAPVGGGACVEARADRPLPAGKGFADIAGVGTRGADAEAFGEYARDMVYGRTDSLRAASEGTNSQGGWLVPTPMAAGVLDLARNQAQVINAGASVVPMSSETLKLARLDGDPVAGWRSEHDAIASSDAVFGGVTLSAKSLAVNVRASWELVEDAGNFGAVLQDSLAKAFALKLDFAALYGVGGGSMPTGLLSTNGVTISTVATNGAAATWDPFISGVSAVNSANHKTSGILLPEVVEAKLASLKDSAGQYLPPPAYLSSVPRYRTQQVATNITTGTTANTADAFIGDWSNLLIGVRTSFALKVLNERYADTGEVGFIGWLRADVQVARTDAFRVVRGLIY